MNNSIINHLNKTFANAASFYLVSNNLSSSDTDGSSTQQLLITIEPLEDYDSISIKQFANSIAKYFEDYKIKSDNKFISIENEWLTTLLEVSQDYSNLKSDVYQYINIIITDLTIHLTITDPSL